MVQLGTVVKITDKTGAVLGQCIKVLGASGRRIAYMGQLIMVSIRWINSKRIARTKARHQRRYAKGTVHRALIVRSSKNVKRITGVLVRFNENAVVFVNKKVVPVSNRVYGPILHEFCTRWPSLGCVTRTII